MLPGSSGTCSDAAIMPRLVSQKRGVGFDAQDIVCLAAGSQRERRFRRHAEQGGSAGKSPFDRSQPVGKVLAGAPHQEVGALWRERKRATLAQGQ